MPVKNHTSELSQNVGFAAAVAEFGMLLRNRSTAVRRATPMPPRWRDASAAPILMAIVPNSSGSSNWLRALSQQTITEARK